MKRNLIKRINVNHLLMLAFVFLIVERFYRFGTENMNLGWRGLIFGLIAGLYAVRFTWKNDNDLKATLKLIVVNLWCIFHILALNKPAFFEAERFLFVVFGWIWLTYEIMERLLRIKPFHSNKVLFVGALFLVFEVLFRVFRWPGGSMIQLIVYLVIAIGFLIDAKKWNKIRFKS